MAKKQRGTGCMIQFDGSFAQPRCLIQWKREVAANDDTDHRLVLDFSSDPESETPTENHTPEEGGVELYTQKIKVSTKLLSGMESKVQGEPMSIEEATACPDNSKWKQAMTTEMRSLKDMQWCLGACGVMTTEMRYLKDNDVWELRGDDDWDEVIIIG